MMKHLLSALCLTIAAVALGTAPASAAPRDVSASFTSSFDAVQQQCSCYWIDTSEVNVG